MELLEAYPWLKIYMTVSQFFLHLTEYTHAMASTGIAYWLSIEFDAKSLTNYDALQLQSSPELYCWPCQDRT